MLKLLTPEQLEKQPQSDYLQEVANVMKNIMPELCSLNDPRQHFSIAGSIIVSCINEMRIHDREFAQILIEEFTGHVEGALKMIMTENEGKPH